MLARIAGDNLARTLEGVARTQNLRLERIAALVSKHPTFELRAGSELDSLPARLLDGLR
jgi:hypothetical protein